VSVTPAGPDTQIQQLEQLHELILAAAAEGIYGLDLEGRTTFVNAAATRILGWCEQDLIGVALHDIHHHSHEDGSHYPREDCPIYATLQDGKVHHVENEVFWSREGQAVPVEYTSTPIFADNQLTGAVIVFRDTSERRRAEKERETAFVEISRLKEQLQQERDYLRDEIQVQSNFGEIIGESQALKRTLSQIEAVASTQTSVLVLGESGVGKEMVARAIHNHSDRAQRPLVKVNCASVPKDLFESEFFGHVRGSFTGAHRDRVGRLELANGGTLFLDEVGEIPIDQQGKLLRALQEQEFERIGDERTTAVDVRIIAATNRDLQEEIRHGRFREDLYYRLSVFPIEVPPLRDRRADILPLAQSFIQRLCEQQGRPSPRLSRSGAELLQQHHWPGNIRELHNVIERAVILSPGESLRVELALPGVLPVQSEPASLEEYGEFLTDSEFRQLEKANLVKALRKADWKIAGDSGAAALLGLKPSTLTYRISRYGIRRAD
jgi:PAS domain S-box-containing protein